MSVVVTVWVPGDTDKFREFVSNNADMLREIQGKARSQGCLAHRFAVGDGHVLVIDEWESGEQFQQFFQDPQIAQVMQDGGASGEPNIAILDAIESADQF